VEDGALLVAERPIRAREEIFHLYNANSSAMLWMVYGFLEDRGGHEDGGDVAVDVVDVDVDDVDVVDDDDDDDDDVDDGHTTAASPLPLSS
jgi:hypothetical protein